MQRYFLKESIATDKFILPAEVEHHFVTVLRAQVGTKAEFVLPDQETVVVAKVTALEPEVEMEIIERKQAGVELPVDVTLVIGLAKGDKPELVAQKATELGVHHIIIVETDWSVVHWGAKAERKLERLRKIMQGAAEQSHRLRIPDVTYAERLAELNLPQSATKLVAWEESAKQGEQSNLVQAFNALHAQDELVFLIGPEGGLKETELEYLIGRDFVPVGLGPRILRAETAPLYMLSALSYALELGN